MCQRDNEISLFFTSGGLSYLERLQPDSLQVTIPVYLLDNFVHAAMVYNFYYTFYVLQIKYE